MFSTVSVPRDVAAILSPDTFGQMTENAQMALQGAWISHTDTLKTNLEKIAELSASNKDLTEDLSRMEAAKVRNKLILLFIMLILNIDTFRTRVWVGLTSWRVR